MSAASSERCARRASSEVGDARIVGAGATATSAVVALGELGANRVEVVARRGAAVAPLVELGAAIGVDVVGVAVR